MAPMQHAHSISSKRASKETVPYQDSSRSSSTPHRRGSRFGILTTTKWRDRPSLTPPRSPQNVFGEVLPCPSDLPVAAFTKHSPSPLRQVSHGCVSETHPPGPSHTHAGNVVRAPTHPSRSVKSTPHIQHPHHGPRTPRWAREALGYLNSTPAPFPTPARSTTARSSFSVAHSEGLPEGPSHYSAATTVVAKDFSGEGLETGGADEEVAMGDRHEDLSSHSAASYNGHLGKEPSRGIPATTIITEGPPEGVLSGGIEDADTGIYGPYEDAHEFNQLQGHDASGMSSASAPYSIPDSRSCGDVKQVAHIIPKEDVAMANAGDDSVEEMAHERVIDVDGASGNTQTGDTVENTARSSRSSGILTEDTQPQSAPSPHDNNKITMPAGDTTATSNDDQDTKRGVPVGNGMHAVEWCLTVRKRPKCKTMNWDALIKWEGCREPSWVALEHNKDSSAIHWYFWYHPKAKPSSFKYPKDWNFAQSRLPPSGYNEDLEQALKAARRDYGGLFHDLLSAEEALKPSKRKRAAAATARRAAAKNRAKRAPSPEF